MMFNGTVRFAARLAAAVAVAVSMMFASAAAAGAQDAPEDWVPVTGVLRLPGPPGYSDYSGGTLNPDGTLLIVDNRQDDVIEYLPTAGGGWTYGRVIDLNASPLTDSIDDLEDITRMGNNKYAVIDEADNVLTVFTLLPGATTVQEVYSTPLASLVPRFSGNGIEGLDYAFEESAGQTDVFYVSSEVNAVVVRLEIVNGTVTNKGPDINLNVRSASAVVKVPGEDIFYVVSNSARELYRMSADGLQLGRERALAFDLPEGLTFSEDGSRMIVIGESGGGNQLQEFRPADVPADVVSARTLPNGDATQTQNGSVVTNAQTVEFADGPYRSGGLRFESVCIPRDAQIKRASLTFVPAASSSQSTQLRIVADRGVPSAPIQATQNNLSNRTSTVTVVQGSIGSWVEGARGREFSPDVTALLDEIKTLPGRAECDPVTFRISTVGARRVARSAETGSWGAPALVIDLVPRAARVLAVEASSECRAGGARIVATVTNDAAAATSASVRLGNAVRGLQLPGGSSGTVTFDGIADGRLLVTASASDVVTGSAEVLANCGDSISITSGCLGGDGVVNVFVLNKNPTSFQFTVEFDPGDVKTLDLYSWEQGVASIAGRPDGTVEAVIRQLGAEVGRRTVRVSCDPLPAREVTLNVSCVGQSGQVLLTLFNDGGTASEFEVFIAGQQPQTRLVDAGTVESVFLESYADGLVDASVERDGRRVFVGFRLVLCRGVVPPDFAPPPAPVPEPPAQEAVTVTVDCIGGNGRIKATIVNTGDSLAQYTVTVGSLPPRTAFISANGRAIVTITGRPDGDIDYSVAREATTIATGTVTVSCDAS